MSFRPVAASRSRALSRALLASTVLFPIVSLTALPAAAQQGETLPTINVTASRLFDGIVGASTSVITAEDIAHSPAQSVQEIIAQTPGVQTQSFYGGVNGAGTSVDLRGFGAFATANTLFLINGRRLNDLDLQGVDLSSIPRDSIERIEITKGNSGAVLYGDNAVGGVINIVTKTGAGGPPATFRAEGGVGSFNQRMAAISAAANHGPWSTSVFANGIRSDGYRRNNALDQNNATADIRYATPDLTAFFNLSGDDQRLGFPGVRRVFPNGVNELASDRRGADTPFDFGNKQGVNATAGFNKSLWNGAELIVDGGVRRKDQQSAFFGNPTDPFPTLTYVDSDLLTWSITPRLNVKNVMFGLPSSIIAGIDYYDSTYASKRSQLVGDPPNHIYNLTQQTLAGYWQQTVAVLPSTDLSYGGRLQSMRLSARDRFDPLAPFGALAAEATPLDTEQTNHALHIGIDHRFNESFGLFARAAQAFRTPNVDERVVTGPAYSASFVPIPQTFGLKTQTSNDVEGGFRFKSGAFEMQSSVYNMNLNNEIHFNPVNFFNYNLDPTRRSGSETSASFRVSDTLLLRGGGAYTRATFREGPFAGNEIPLVSRYTGNAGVTWNVWQKYVVLDATLRAWSSRWMDNDQRNFQSKIPGNATVDLKLSGEYDHFFWSVSANNLLNALYYDYAIASAATLGRFNAYPLPGRTYMVKAGMTF
jgi:iron complex outermembrane receptor protein